jgi:hypothetical protein
MGIALGANHIGLHLQLSMVKSSSSSGMVPTRLINTKTLGLVEICGSDWEKTKYATLSHRWVYEVSYQEW